jgi:hypothetical protein
MKKHKIKIVEFYLKNYAPFYESMGLQEFHFDKRDAPYDLTLIIAQNGIGKSFLITELSPELLEHISGRIANRFIPGMEGEKRVHYIVDDETEYVCAIYYNKDHKASCYFKRINLASGEEEELNPNGNVSSYLELCQHYLSYNKTYKNVGYITSNVRNVVTMPFAERQQLFSTWIPDTSQFLSASRIVQKKVNSTKKEVENLVADITKISISSYKENLANFKSNLATIEKDLLFYRDHISKINLLLGSTFSRFEKELLKEHIVLFKKKCAEHEGLIQKNKELFTKYGRYLNNEGEKQLAQDISQLKERKAFLESALNGVNDKLSMVQNALSRIRSTQDSQEDGTNTEQNIVSTDTAINNLKESVVAVEKNIQETLEANPEFTEIFYSDELKGAIKQIMTMLLSVYQIASTIIQTCDGFSVKDLFLPESSVMADYNATIEALTGQNKTLEESIKSLSENEEKMNKLQVDDSFLAFIPEGCNETTCSLVCELKSHLGTRTLDVKEEITRKGELLKQNRDQLTSLTLKINSVETIIRSVTQINNILFDHKQEIILLPKYIYEQINNPQIADFIYGVNSIIHDLQEVDEYVSLLEKRKSSIESIHNLKNIYDLLKATDSMNSETAVHLEEEKRLYQEREEVNTELGSVTEDLLKLTNLNESITGILEEKSRIESNRTILESEREKLFQENSGFYHKRILQSVLSSFKNKETDLVKNESLMKGEIEKCTAMITNRAVLEERKEAFEEKLKLYELLYAVWNPRTGYPSMLIKEFLDEVTFVTNTSLDNIWGGLIRIQDFVLTENEFRIPIVRGNTILEDITECSNAEKNTLALAISLAIIQVSTSYNVIRIDEADDGFDDLRRQTFLDMITRQLMEAGCTDSYLITHNQFFENIPCNVILLKGYDQLITQSSLENKHILYKYPSL